MPSSLPHASAHDFPIRQRVQTSSDLSNSTHESTATTIAPDLSLSDRRESVTQGRCQARASSAEFTRNQTAGSKEEERAKGGDGENESQRAPLPFPKSVHSHAASMRPHSSSIARYNNVAERNRFMDSTTSTSTESPPASPSSSKRGAGQKPPVRWRDLPSKGQLVILTLSRLSEPLTQTSLQSYMFYQLRSFNPSLPDSTISYQVGILQGCFTFAQFVTAVLWGRVADSPRVGRKRVLLVGLFGTTISCLGFGFSRSFWHAMAWRTLGGALNGNVGVMRTMISEIVREKRFQSRAFLLMPMCFNIGVIIGPVLGGLLADPVSNYPKAFGKKSVFGGQEGVWWLIHWPYALPNLISAIFLLFSALAVVFGLEETLESIRGRPDLGLRLARLTSQSFYRLFGGRRGHRYTAVRTSDTDEDLEDLMSPSTPPRARDIELASVSQLSAKPTTRRRRSFRSILTPTVLLTLLCQAILALHISTFNTLWFTHLSAPRSSNPRETTDLPFHFTGGLALPPQRIGLVLASLGSMGIILQLGLYPAVTTRFGTIPTWRAALICFPLAYAFAPYLSVIPSRHPPPGPVDGWRVYLGILAVLFIQVLGRTFAIPAQTILVNNSAPAKEVLGTVHGIGQSVSSGARTLGPVLGGWGYGVGLRRGVVGAVWWGMALVGIVGFVVSWTVREGTEIGENMDSREKGEVKEEDVNK